jgi:hypothetical protein
MGATGLDKESLAATEPYAGLIGQTVVLQDGDDRYWTLRSFDSGRQFLQYSPQLEGASYSTRMIARLDGSAITINAIYNDKINGGVYFDAELVHDGQPIELRRNRWTDALLEYERQPALPLE